MRLRNIPGSDEEMERNPYVIKNAESLKGNWTSVWGNNHPIQIEIGMGKGQFILSLAKEHPQINYIGIEKYSSVLLRALQKLENEPLDNIRFLCIDAQVIESIFAPEEIDKIYLNFSDPWPKDRHAKRRLTSKEFFARYDYFLKKDGVVEFKTDNNLLFTFSLDEVKEAGWQLEAYTFDLHHDPTLNKDNIMTEYEEKFSNLGNPIHKLIAFR